ncbi:MerR family DNA-binding protein [Streptomyces sp. NPDC059949]|uniref:MerR family DNA-binding protein n=1 Tax=Streptomyces sp. NPDC059949 TaxID=3347013 RepID=UPI003665998C
MRTHFPHCSRPRIRDAQGAGLTLAEIRSVLALRDDGQSPCGHVTALIGQHLADIERRLAELRETAPPCASWPSGRPRPTPTPAARTGSAPSSRRTDGATPALTNGRRSSTTTCSPSPSRSRTRASPPRRSPRS